MAVRSFKNYLEQREARPGGLDYRSALDLVLTRLGVPSPGEGAKPDDVNAVLGMPLKGYGRDAAKRIAQEPTIRELPNFQSDILPALGRSGTTVGHLAGLIADGGPPAQAEPAKEDEADPPTVSDNPEAPF